MKTIHNAVIEHLKAAVPALKWIDKDKGQLKKTENGQKPAVAYPCALIGITLTKCSDIYDGVQDCDVSVSVKLAFDPYLMDRTSAEVPEDVRNESLEPYDIIADVYAALQGFDGDDKFDPLSRTAQGEEAHDKLFIYKQVFKSSFEDHTAEQ